MTRRILHQASVVVEDQPGIALEVHARHVERNIHRHPESIGYPAGPRNAVRTGSVSAVSARNP